VLVCPKLHGLCSASEANGSKDMVIDISVLDTAGRDDLWARFKVPEWRAFYHTARLRNHPARLKLVLSDSAEVALLVEVVLD
jgi:hypothetical protein